MSDYKWCIGLYYVCNRCFELQVISKLKFGLILKTEPVVCINDLNGS